MTFEKYNRLILELLNNETDPQKRETLQLLYDDAPWRGSMRDVPCKVNGKQGYGFICWMKDDVLRPSDQLVQRTYAIILDKKHNHIMRVRPEKIEFDKHEAARWEDLHG